MAAAALATAAVLAPPQPAGAAENAPVGTFTEPPYGCTAEPASSVVAPVTSGAGAGKP